MLTKKEMNDLDISWVKGVKERDNYTCQICKKKVSGHNCQAHHIIPKGVKLTRWDLENGITLCYQHHKVGLYSAHMNAVWFTFWLKTNKLKQFNFIIKKLQKLERERRNDEKNSNNNSK